MPQLPYAPDLAPADFFLFPKLKTQMKGKHFAMIEEIKEKSKQELLVFTRIRKNAGLSMLYLRAVTLKGIR